MASPAELVVDLGDVVELLDAQVDAGLPRDDVLQSLFNSWTTRLSGAAKLAPKGKAQVTKAIKDGPWDEHQKRDLARIVLGGGQATTNTHSQANPKAYAATKLCETGYLCEAEIQA